MSQLSQSGGTASEGTGGEAEEARLAHLERTGRFAEALALCERLLADLAESAGDSEALRLEAQLNQRRLRLRRKLGLPTWSSQGAPF